MFILLSIQFCFLLVLSILIELIKINGDDTTTIIKSIFMILEQMIDMFSLQQQEFNAAKENSAQISKLEPKGNDSMLKNFIRLEFALIDSPFQFCNQKQRLLDQYVRKKTYQTKTIDSFSRTILRTLIISSHWILTCQQIFHLNHRRYLCKEFPKQIYHVFLRSG